MIRLVPVEAIMVKLTVILAVFLAGCTVQAQEGPQGAPHDEDSGPPAVDSGPAADTRQTDSAPDTGPGTDAPVDAPEAHPVETVSFPDGEATSHRYPGETDFSLDFEERYPCLGPVLTSVHLAGVSKTMYCEETPPGSGTCKVGSFGDVTYRITVNGADAGQVQLHAPYPEADQAFDVTFDGLSAACTDTFELGMVPLMDTAGDWAPGAYSIPAPGTADVRF